MSDKASRQLQNPGRCLYRLLKMAIQGIVGGRETNDHDGPFDTALKGTPNLAFRTQNGAEVEHENLVAKTCKRAYLGCLEGGSKGISWADRSGESEAPTPSASCLPDPPSYLGNSTPHLLSIHKLSLHLPPILHLETHYMHSGGDEKGKCRMAVTDIEAEEIIWGSDQEAPFDDSTEGNGGLTLAEKDEQSQRDAELSLLLLAQELLEQGVPQEEIASYAFQTQLLAMSPHTTPALAFSIHSPESLSSHCIEGKPDLDRIAQLTIDGVATRPLPPAYGAHYSPEPSTSQAGSPILAVRRLSISSTISSVSTSSASSAALSSSYTLEEEGELVARMQQVLDERYEANKVALLCDLDKQANKMKKPEQTNLNRRWDMWRHRFGLGLVGGVDEKLTSRDPQHPGHSLLSFPLDLPDDAGFLQGGHSRRHQHDQGSAAHTPQGLTPRGGPDQSHISPQGTGAPSMYNIQGLGTWQPRL